MMVPLTDITLEDPSHYEDMRAGSTARYWMPPAVRTELRLTTPSGNAIPCQRQNGGWFNFVLPAETPHICLDMTATGLCDQSVRELILFVGAQEWSLPIPPALASSSKQDNQARTALLTLPPIPNWVQGLLCIRLEPAEQTTIWQNVA